jgi:hypothetical protein
MKRALLILCVTLGLTWIASVRTDGFSPHLIEGPLFAPASPIPPNAEAILSQPFHYLAKGRQSFVFTSADGKYVLKFFNQKYLRDPWYALFTRGEKAKRALRRHFYENSYEIACREFGEEIVYLHLGPSTHPLPSLALIDKASRSYTIDLNRLPFVLQKKGTPFYEGLEAAYRKEGLEGLCRQIDAFVSAISERVAKNIADGDRDVENNWGYIEGRIVHLDPGRLYYDANLVQPARRQAEWYESTRAFHRWLKAHYPEAADHLAKRLHDENK